MRVNVISINGSEKTLSLTGSFVASAPGEKLPMNLIQDDLWESEVFVTQSKEWMQSCPHKDRCPAAGHYLHLIAMYSELTRKRNETKTLKDWIKVIEKQSNRYRDLIQELQKQIARYQDEVPKRL